MNVNKIISFLAFGVLVYGVSLSDAYSSTFSKFAIDDTDKEIQDYKMTFPDEVLMEKLEPERQIIIDSNEEFCAYLKDRFSLYHTYYQKLLKLQNSKSQVRDPSKISVLFLDMPLLEAIGLTKVTCDLTTLALEYQVDLTDKFASYDLLSCFNVCLKCRTQYLESRFINKNKYLNGKGLYYPSTHEKDIVKQSAFNQMQARDSILKFDQMNEILKGLCYAMNERGESSFYNPFLDEFPLLKKYILNQKKSHPRPDDSFDDCSIFIKNNFTPVVCYEDGKQITKIYHNDDLLKFYHEESNKNSKHIYLKNPSEKQLRVGLKKMLEIEQKAHSKEIRAQQVEDMKQGERKIEKQSLEKRKNEQKIKDTDNQNVISTESRSIKNIQSNRSEESNSNEISIICSPKPEKYVPSCIRVKEKTRGTPNSLIIEEKESPSSLLVQENKLPDIIVHGAIWSLVSNFWEKKAGFTYEDFKTLFIKLGGDIDESTGSSHMILIYTNEKGEAIKGGIWKYHYPVTGFGYHSMKMLKEYMEKCGLTLDRIRCFEV